MIDSTRLTPDCVGVLRILLLELELEKKNISNVFVKGPAKN